MPLGTTKEVNLPNGYKGSIELNRYAKLTGVNITTKVDTSTRKVNLTKANESQGVDNNLDNEKLTCLKNQAIMTIQSVVANRNGMFEDKLV